MAAVEQQVDVDRRKHDARSARLEKDKRNTRLRAEYVQSIESSEFFAKYDMWKDQILLGRAYSYDTKLPGMIIEVQPRWNGTSTAYAEDTALDVNNTNRRFFVEFCEFFVGDAQILGLDSYLSKNLNVELNSTTSGNEFRYEDFEIRSGKVLRGGFILISWQDRDSRD